MDIHDLKRGFMKPGNISNTCSCQKINQSTSGI